MADESVKQASSPMEHLERVSSSMMYWHERAMRAEAALREFQHPDNRDNTIGAMYYQDLIKRVFDQIGGSQASGDCDAG